MKKADELRTLRIDPLITPATLAARYVITSDIMKMIFITRNNISRILNGQDKRLLVIMGPCSIHDPASAIEYAKKLRVLRDKFSSRLEIIMRTYFEKPRTIVGWKGLISDPYLDETFKVNEGLAIARNLLLKINMIGVPTATEFLDTVIAQFIADLISWGAIGARTTESQIHREMASALSCPIGFKNGTDGNILIAIDAIRSAQSRHVFLVPDKNGKIIINYTAGNPYGHIIMRGGKTPNYHKNDIFLATQELKKVNLKDFLIVDFSHGNSLKKHKRQHDVAESISKQIYDGSTSIAGVMIESFLKEGAQPVNKIENLNFGQSITDSCLNWEDSLLIVEKLAKSVSRRF